MVSGPVTGGHGWAFGSSPVEHLDARGYVLEEYLIEGEADSYELAPGSEVTTDSAWDTVSGKPAPYKTRMMVVRPRDPSKFNGIVLLNWQNVTAGVDLGAPTDEEMFRQGYVWVGATVQQVAMTGVTVTMPGYDLPPVKGLPAWDPARYGTLSHPGDAYCFDMYAQIGRAISGRRAGGPDPMHGLVPSKIIAMGGSQSAACLAGYLGVAHAHDRLFDGFLLEVHWGNSMWPHHSKTVVLPGGDIVGTYQVRDDLGVPIFVVNSETEAWSVFPVRQPDTDTYRFWEVAGGTHGGNRPVDALAEIMARDGVETLGMLDSAGRNTIDWSCVQSAALRAMTAWVTEGTPPPTFPLIELVEGPLLDSVVRDANGNAKGGVRIPEMEAPIAAQWGVNSTPDMLAKLSGERHPFSEEQLRALYPSRDAYLSQYDAAAERLVQAGGLLPEDLPAVRAHGRELADALPHDT
ncbi:MAG: alpha/beta hydrolase domain-containing protein [Acidimicrobiia bacterium]